MPAPRKRPANQPAITTFFTPSTPALDPETAASLINVGMRVRSSVPQGYRTGTYAHNNYFSVPGALPPSAFSTPPTSQDSVASNASMKKRARDAEAEEEDEDVDEFEMDAVVPAPARKIIGAAGNTAANGNGNGNGKKRLFHTAVARKPVAGAQGAAGKKLDEFCVPQLEEFGEPGFLRPEEEVRR